VAAIHSTYHSPPSVSIRSLSLPGTLAARTPKAMANETLLSHQAGIGSFMLLALSSDSLAYIRDFKSLEASTMKTLALLRSRTARRRTTVVVVLVALCAALLPAVASRASGVFGCPHRRPQTHPSITSTRLWPRIITMHISSRCA
jgi:hypothetical protein